MVRGVRRAASAAAVIACLAAASPAPAQTGDGGSDEPFSGPELEEKFPGENGQQGTPTPTPSAEATPEETETPEATASPEPTATATPTPSKNGRKNLPNTGTDPLRVGLMGLTLLGFGLSLRMSLTEARRRN